MSMSWVKTSVESFHFDLVSQICKGGVICLRDGLWADTCRCIFDKLDYFLCKNNLLHVHPFYVILC